MKTLPERNAITFFLKGFGKSPADMFLPDFGKYPVGYRLSGPLQISVLYEPSLVHHFLGKENKNLSKNIPATQNLRLALGHGIVTTHGQEWLEQRRKFQAYYPKTLDSTEVMGMEELMAIHIRELKQEKVKNWDTLKIGVLSCLIDLNWFRLFGCAFPGNKTEIIRHMFLGNRLLAMAVATKIPVYDALVKAQLRNCYTGLQKTVASAIQKPGIFGPGITADEVINLLMAGVLTTAGNLLFCLLHLSCDPVKFRQFLTDETFSRFTLMENFRLYPEVWSLWYLATNSMEFGSIRVRQNELLVFDLYSMHRHPRFWKQPTLFNPERFSNPDFTTESYLPFGHGPRKCLGQHLAFTMLSAFLKQLGQAFKFTITPGAEIKAQFGAVLFPDLKSETLYFEDKKGN